MSMNPIVKNIILTPFNLLYRISPRRTLELLFRLKQGCPLHLEDPKTYSEKLQWIKLYYKNPLMTKLVDKYTAREYVGEKCPELLVPLLWQGFDPKDIPWDSLPDRFVVKVTHGSGFNIICTDKSALDRKKAEKKLRKWLKAKYLRCYGEWFYGVERPRIVVEEFLDAGTGNVPADYKLMCFGGKPEYILVDNDRFNGHKRNIYDTQMRFQPGTSMGDFPNAPVETVEEDVLRKLLSYAATLSEGFPHVRVDLYIIGEKIYFGEMTFTTGAGFDPIRPAEFHRRMGDLLVLPDKDLFS